MVKFAASIIISSVIPESRSHESPLASLEILGDVKHYLNLYKRCRLEWTLQVEQKRDAEYSFHGYDSRFYSMSIFVH